MVLQTSRTARHGDPDARKRVYDAILHVISPLSVPSHPAANARVSFRYARYCCLYAIYYAYEETPVVRRDETARAPIRIIVYRKQIRFSVIAPRNGLGTRRRERNTRESMPNGGNRVEVFQLPPGAI